MLKKEDYEPGFWTEEKNLTVEETRLPFTEELAGVIPQPEENREIPDGIQVVLPRMKAIRTLLSGIAAMLTELSTMSRTGAFRLSMSFLESSIYRLLRCRNLCSTAILTLPFPSVIHIWIRAA